MDITAPHCACETPQPAPAPAPRTYRELLRDEIADQQATIDHLRAENAVLREALTKLNADRDWTIPDSLRRFICNR